MRVCALYKQIEVRLPAALKEILVNEHEAFKKGLKLPPIPRKPSVMDILNEYVKECHTPGPNVTPEEKVRFYKAPSILYQCQPCLQQIPQSQYRVLLIRHVSLSIIIEQMMWFKGVNSVMFWMSRMQQV